ncbi:MAG TPA: glycosyltransferase family 4 protein [Bacteroidota bacterium]|nr:glycosyltransferase family 4 protein [Bacteroidota bacterium]
MIAANTSWYLQNFRGEIFRDLSSAGIEVVALAPRDEFTPRFDDLGARFVELRMNRRGMNPFADLMLMQRLYRTYSQERPDVVLHNTIKPVIYGSIAAGRAGVRRIVNMISGLGYVFIGDGIVQRLLRPLVHRLYRHALRRADVVLFQNPDDRKYFVDHHLVQAEKSEVIPGSGVDTKRFEYVGSRNTKTHCTFLFVGRILKDKGVLEFVDAAKLVKRSFPKARFQVLGKIDPENPSHIDRSEVERWVNEGTIEYLGERGDVRDVLGRADVVVLPSYREGVPRSILEAMAMGKAVITTDVPGCRETVEHERNGLLVPPKDVSSLNAAMVDLLRHPGKRAQMGKEGREIAETRFDVRIVNKQIFRAMGIVPQPVIEKRLPAKKRNRR